MSEYQKYGLNITFGEFKKILTASKQDRSVIIRILKKSTRRSHAVVNPIN